MPRWQRVRGGVGVGRGSIGAAAIAFVPMVWPLRARGAETPSPSPSVPLVELDPGPLWKGFAETLALLTPIAVFVGGFALVVIALGRLLAFTPIRWVRDPVSTAKWRSAAWAVGLVLAVGVPVAAALRALWIMRGDGPNGVFIPQTENGSETGFVSFALGAFVRSGYWWVLMLLSVAAVLALAFAFASRQGVTIRLTSKGDGSGLDSAHIMAAMDGMAGRLNRGLEFPVGTDLTAVSSAVSELSKNKVVATLQVAVSAILGTTPWTLAVDNEGADAASVTISRNGTLVKAKRVRLGHTLTGVNELTAAEQLAALIAGELIANLRTRYRAEYDADLSGATDGESIALHFIVSSALADDRERRARGIPILARAVEVDPQNRAAWTTLANFAYRDPKVHTAGDPQPHLAYRDLLTRAIDDELARMRRRGQRQARSERATAPRDHQTPNHVALPAGAWGITDGRLRGNALLGRLLQTRAAAAANALAASADRSDDPRGPSFRRLRRIVQGGGLSSREPWKTAVRRRQLLLLDEFRAVDPGTRPEVLELTPFAAELAAWNSADASGGARRVRVAQENAALSVRGDFAHDPIVAYAVACYRAQSNRWHTPWGLREEPEDT